MKQGSKLAMAIRLRARVAVYVPATQGVSAAADNSAQVARVAEALSGWFGGATATPAVGYWKSAEAGLVAERTTIVYAFAAEADLSAHIDDVVELCMAIKTEMEQEAVSLEVNGDLYLI